MSDPKRLSFKERINQMLEEIGTFHKTRAQGLRYSFLAYDDMAPAIRNAVVKAEVIPSIHTEIVRWETIKVRDGQHQHVVVNCHFTYQDCHSDEFSDYQAHGEGADAYDKALNKAITSAWKNAHKFGFLVATGDASDAEYDQGTQAMPARATVALPKGAKADNGADRAAEIGKRLAARREEANLTPAALAKQAGLKTQRVKDIEAGLSAPTADEVMKLQGALAGQ